MEATLYILIRKDIQDMNPGKAAAQACHAQADFDFEVDINDELGARVAHWKEFRSFGRTLVVHATLAQIQDVCSMIEATGRTVDPTYPWRDWYGDVHISEEVTAGWAFVDDASRPGLVEYLKTLPLMP